MSENLGAWNGLLRISRVRASFIDGSSDRRGCHTILFTLRRPHAGRRESGCSVNTLHAVCSLLCTPFCLLVIFEPEKTIVSESQFPLQDRKDAEIFLLCGALSIKPCGHLEWEGTVGP